MHCMCRPGFKRAKYKAAFSQYRCRERREETMAWSGAETRSRRAPCERLGGQQEERCRDRVRYAKARPGRSKGRREMVGVENSERRRSYMMIYRLREIWEALGAIRREATGRPHEIADWLYASCSERIGKE
ncbi:hypothetical protein OH77DRAFT_988201 [Trametes cingulata]|nr:hypothetical protein OH77DRAFT_988201 [Trametes cingulata]